jgi:hypothetical protein
MINEKLEELVASAKKLWGNAAGALVEGCRFNAGNTCLDIASSEYCALRLSNQEVRIEAGEYVIFDPDCESIKFGSRKKVCDPERVKVYSPDLTYRFIIYTQKEKDSRKGYGGGGNTFYSRYYGRDFEVYEGMQD